MGDTVLYELDGHVATITYNRPDVAQRGQRRDAARTSTPRSAASATTRTRGSASSPARGEAFCAGGDIKRRRRLGRRVRGHVLGEADDQLVRERVGDLQARHRRGERLLPRLRAHAGDVVRLRHRERARRVRVPRGAARRARRSSARSGSRRRLNWQYAMELLLTGERIDAARAKEIGLAGLGGAPRRR